MSSSNSYVSIAPCFLQLLRENIGPFTFIGWATKLSSSFLTRFFLLNLPFHKSNGVFYCLVRCLAVWLMAGRNLAGGFHASYATLSVRTLLSFFHHSNSSQIQQQLILNLGFMVDYRILQPLLQLWPAIHLTLVANTRGSSFAMRLPINLT